MNAIEEFDKDFMGFLFQKIIEIHSNQCFMEIALLYFVGIYMSVIQCIWNLIRKFAEIS